MMKLAAAQALRATATLPGSATHPRPCGTGVQGERVSSPFFSPNAQSLMCPSKISRSCKHRCCKNAFAQSSHPKREDYSQPLLTRDSHILIVSVVYFIHSTPVFALFAGFYYWVGKISGLQALGGAWRDGCKHLHGCAGVCGSVPTTGSARGHGCRTDIGWHRGGHALP